MVDQPLVSSDVKGGYKPTLEQKKSARIKPDKFLLCGDGVFHTIQGEGNRAGVPTTFIRLHMCNLQCERCDAWYTWRTDTKEYYEEPFYIDSDKLIDEIWAQQEAVGVQERVLNITFTGGEPLLHARQIEQFMKDNDYLTVQIETNGTLPASDYLLQHAKFNCSPKIGNSSNDLRLRFRLNVLEKLGQADTIFKFVIQQPEDIDEVLEKYDFLPKNKIRFMPEGVTKEQNAQVFERCIDRLVETGVNVTCRNQNIMRDGAKRGV